MHMYAKSHFDCRSLESGGELFINILI